jgi:hypothetical protein
MESIERQNYGDSSRTYILAVGASLTIRFSALYYYTQSAVTGYIAGPLLESEPSSCLGVAEVRALRQSR